MYTIQSPSASENKILPPLTLPLTGLRCRHTALPPGAPPCSTPGMRSEHRHRAPKAQCRQGKPTARKGIRTRRIAALSESALRDGACSPQGKTIYLPQTIPETLRQKPRAGAFSRCLEGFEGRRRLCRCKRLVIPLPTTHVARATVLLRCVSPEGTARFNYEKSASVCVR